jgi:signal transduction histidine kinase
MAITYLSITHFHQASTQLLNKDVAAHIAKFTSPFESTGINKQKADSVFQNAMVLSPSAEVYFLDTAGNVIAYHAPEKEIKLRKLPLREIHELINSKGEVYKKGPDPKEPLNPKIFSAAEVKNTNGTLGYIYVILTSNKNVSGNLYTTYFSSLLVKAFCVVIVLSIIFSFIYLNRITRSFNRMTGVLQRFEAGDFTARFTTKDEDKLAPVTNSFNKMADLLVYNINRLTKSESVRKDFIRNISHDLKTPLSIAKGYTETLLMDKDKDELSKVDTESYLHIISNKIQQVDSMVNQLFKLSKIESAEFKPSKEPFVLSEIVQESVKDFQLLCAKKNITLKCTQCQYHVWVNADVSMTDSVIQNLIGNAVYNTSEEGHIQVSMEVDSADLRFKVVNPGTALPDDLLTWINNADNESELPTNWSSRSGVGLLIVKKILHLHGSFLHAYTQKETGNVFTFSLPVFNMPA